MAVDLEALTKTIGINPVTMLRKARLDLITNHPFFGFMCSQFKFIVVEPDHPFCRTACVNAKSRQIFFNPIFMAALTESARTFVVCHELMHVVNETFSRIGSRDQKLWNYATDYAINLLVTDAGLKMVTNLELERALLALGSPSSGRASNPDALACLYNEDYRGLTSEEIYDTLAADGVADCVGTLDQHVYGGGSNEDGFTPIPGDECDPSDTRNLKILVNAAAQYDAKKGGRALSAGLTRIIEEINANKVDWRSELAAVVTTVIIDDYTYYPPDERYFGRGITIPDLRAEGDKLRACAVFDTSGSISIKETTDMMSETLGIVRSCDKYEILMMGFDTEVHNPVVFTSEEHTDPKAYTVIGNGGTDYNKPFEYLDESEFEPDIVIFFTDGYPAGDDWCDRAAAKYEVIWVITTDVIAPWGRTLRYDG